MLMCDSIDQALRCSITHMQKPEPEYCETLLREGSITFYILRCSLNISF